MRGPGTQISRKFRANIMGNASHKLCEHKTSSHTSIYTILMSGKRRIPWPIFSGAARSAGNLRASAQLDEPRRRLRREQRRRGETKRSSLPRPRRRSAVHLRPSAAFLDNFPPGSVTYSSLNEIRDFRQLHLRRGRTQISRAFRATFLSPNFGKHCAKLCLTQGKPPK